MKAMDSMFLLLVVALTAMKKFTNGDICTKKICEFDFVIRESRSMMYAVNHPSGWQDVYNVVLNGSKLVLQPTLFHKEVPKVDHETLLEATHTLDGVPVPIILINNMFPGPTIEVMEGAQVVVRVKNDLMKETMTVHWHGMHQRSTYYSDGVPFVSQCPILPKQTFTYRFFAKPAGTHWYHSHMVNQKKDGLYGAVIVHRKLPDLQSQVLVLSDWFHRFSTELEISNPYKTYDRGSGNFHYQTIDRDHSFDGVKLSSLEWTSGLINGRGRYNNNNAPLSVFEVEKGNTYRFHIIGSMAEFSYRLSIDNHTLKVVESDGYPVEPVDVQSVIVFEGETYVVEVATKKMMDLYWIRAETLRDGTGPFVYKDGKPKGSALAVMRYKGSSFVADDPGPLSVPVECVKNKPCKVLNCPWKEFPAEKYPHTYCVHIDTLRMAPSVLNGEVDRSILKVDQKDIHQLFLNFAFSVGSSVNNHRFISPSSGPIYEKEKTRLLPCSEDCADKGCRCTNVVKIPKNKTIQLVLMSYTTVNDFGKNYSNKAHHPIHLHGHSFYVLKQGFGKSNNKTNLINGLNPDIICENKPCSRQKWMKRENVGLNLNNPPMKDTVIVPAQGYTVVRFRSDNPGFWFLHCHTMFHNVEGMALILNETSEEIPKPPDGFPKCTSFEWAEREFSEWISSNKKEIKIVAKNPIIGTSCMNEILVVVFVCIGVQLMVIVLIIAWRFYYRKTDKTKLKSSKMLLVKK